MPPNTSDLATAALEGIATLEDEILFDVGTAIATTDVAKVWDKPMIERLATLDLSAWGGVRVQLMAKFGTGLSVRDLDAAVKAARKRLSKSTARRQPDGDLPVIPVNGRPMHSIADDALKALRLANDPPALFVRAGEIVYIEIDERARPKITAASLDHLRGRLDRCAEYVRRGESFDLPTSPPIEIVRDIMALPSGQWMLPPLDVLVEIPTLRPDGTVLTAAGYDGPSKMYYEPDASLGVVAVPDDPGADDVDAAVELIMDAIGDFPFCTDDEEPDEKPADYERASASRANFFGLLLTPIIRPAISGCTPIALIDAPQAGTGKSLLADVFSIITTGRPCSMMPMPREDNEMQKLLGSTLRAGRPMVCFDNLEGSLQSPALALALTAKEYETRLLGSSENLTAPNRATWLATGNNIRPAGDMPRRCYHIRIDAESDQPYRGRVFKHDPLLEWVTENRAGLLRALLTIARAWYSRGAKRAVESPLGSFEQWHRTIGGMLAGAGVPGFLGNLDPFLAEADDAQIQWERFMMQLHTHYGTMSFTPASICSVIRGSTTLYPSPFDLPDTMGDVDRRREGSLERAIGRSFTKRMGTRLGKSQLHLIRNYDATERGFRWNVEMRG